MIEISEEQYKTVLSNSAIRLQMRVAMCIECGCDDCHACAESCIWIRLDRDAGLGVCSSCAHRAPDWDRGDRFLGEEAAMAVEIGKANNATYQ